MERFVGYNFINVASLAILVLISGTASSQNNNPSKVHYRNARQKFDKLLTTIANVNEKRLDALKQYIELDSYKVGGGILRQVKKKGDRKKPVPSDEATKALIYDALYEELCKDGMYHDQTNYKVMYKPEKKHGALYKKLAIGEEQAKFIINKVLLEMICKKGIIRNTRTRTNNQSTNRSHIDRSFLNKGSSPNLYNNEFYEDLNTEENADVSNNNNVRFHDYDEKNDNGSEDDDDDDDDDYGLEIYSGTILRSSCWKTAIKNCKKACKKALNDVCDEYKCSSSLKKTFKKSCKRYCKQDDDSYERK